MNRIVKEHYPASKLPEDLRAGVDPSATVTVTVVEENTSEPQKVMTLEEIWLLRAPPFRTAQEIDDGLHCDRDEWDD
jgi:hypothetical protein